MTHLIECNFDGIVGPTHHFGGLGVGNVASLQHAGRLSNPRAAALQGLDKITQVARIADPDRVRFAVLPPQSRPDLEWLRALGFRGDDETLLQEALRTSPRLLSAAWSASAMWTANAATVTPACDTMDASIHLTVANLSSSPHRSLEPAQTQVVLEQIFADEALSVVHGPLPGGYEFRDEGAANHMRLCGHDGRGGHHVFVFGTQQSSAGPFLARQSLSACEAIVRRHQLPPGRVHYVEQHPTAIAAGAFHNDVVATSHDDVVLFHEQAFAAGPAALEGMLERFRAEHGRPPYSIMVATSDLPLEEAIATYLFNGQLIPRRAGGMCLVCPVQCQKSPAVQAVLAKILAADNPIVDVQYVDLLESMSNGGGPACLRLRMTLSEAEFKAIHPGVIWRDELESRLRQIISRMYRDRLTAADLADPDFITEAREATRMIRKELGLPEHTLC